MDISYNLDSLQEPERSVWTGMRIGHIADTFRKYKENEYLLTKGHMYRNF